MGNRRTLMALLALAVLGSVLLAGAMVLTVRNLRSESATMRGVAAGTRVLLMAHYGMQRYRIEHIGHETPDGRYASLATVIEEGLLGEAAYRRTDDGVLAGGYRLRTHSISADVPGFVIVAEPRRASWPTLAIDETGTIRRAGEADATDPRTWRPLQPTDRDDAADGSPPVFGSGADAEPVGAHPAAESGGRETDRGGSSDAPDAAPTRTAPGR